MVKSTFPDKYFDLIISAQVAEHLRDDEVIEYYSEEGRVLKKKVWHIMNYLINIFPYESHTRLWLIHLFPYFCKPFCMEYLYQFKKEKIYF